MSLDNQTCRDTHLGDNVATEFEVSFQFLERSHLRVTLVDTDDTLTELVLDVDYTVSGEGLPATMGQVTTDDPLLTDQQLIVERVLPPEQPVDIANLGENYQEVLEEGLDRLGMKNQEAERVLGLWDPEVVRIPKLGPIDVDGAGAYDCRDNKLSNVADAVDPGDAVNFSQVSGITGVLVIVSALPAPDATWYGKSVLVKFPAGPSAAYWCGLQGDDATYEWVSFGVTSA